MTRDVTKLNFYSGDPIDKVVTTGTVTYANDGNTTTTGTTLGYQTAKVQTDTIPNPYGKKAFCRYVWSTDGVNFNSGESRLIYSFSATLTDVPITQTLFGLQAGVSVGVSPSTVYFLTANGLHGTVSTTTGAPGSGSGYVPTPQLFVIKYALFEIL